MPNSTGSLDQSQSPRVLTMWKRNLLRQQPCSRSEGPMPYSLWHSGSREWRALPSVPTLTQPPVRPQRLPESFGGRDLGRARNPAQLSLRRPWTYHVISAPPSQTVFLLLFLRVFGPEGLKTLPTGRGCGFWTEAGQGSPSSPTSYSLGDRGPLQPASSSVK